MSNTITSKLTEIDEYSSLDGLWMELKVFIARASLEQLDKVKWNKKYCISAETSPVG